MDSTITNIPVLNKFPDYFHPENGDDIPEDLIGSEIINIGTPIGLGLEGGGLLIDYKNKTGVIKRLLLAFNELGMWSVDRID